MEYFRMRFFRPAQYTVGQFIADLPDFPCNPVTADLPVHQVMQRAEKASQGRTRPGSGRREVILRPEMAQACQSWT
jgi:hypothetical protein